MADRSPDSELDRLSNLPAELLTSVLSHLPAREICRSRALSKTIKSLIDDNTATITLPTIHFYQQRIKTDLATLSNTGNVGFDEVFKISLRHYGTLDEPYPVRYNALVRVCLPYTRARFPALPAKDSQSTALLFAMVADLLLENGPRKALSLPHVLAVLGDFVGHATAASTMDAIEGVIHDVRSQPTQAVRWPLSAPAELCGRSYHLELAGGWQQTHDNPMRPLVTSLGLAYLTSENQFFEYRLTSPCIRTLVSQKCKAGVGQVTRLEQAAILEDIYIW